MAQNCLRKSVQPDCGTSDIQSEHETEERKKRKSKPNPRYDNGCNNASDTEVDSRAAGKTELAKRPTISPPERQGRNCSPTYPVMQNLQPSNDLPGRGPKCRLIQPPEQSRNESFYGECSLPEQYFYDAQGSSNPTYHSNPEQARNGPEMQWHESRQESRQLMKDIGVNKMTAMLAQVIHEIKEVRQDALTIQTELKEIKDFLGRSSQSSDSLVLTTPSVLLPLKNIEQFDEAERVLQRETERHKMVSRFAMVGGANIDVVVRRMLSAALTNQLACSFNWAGKGTKRAFKETLVQDCMFGAVQHRMKGTTHLVFAEIVKKWLRYAPERGGGIPRK
ncbi:hypothetical protein SKAU_G00118930 [Synaphobranchus kaupii]|uniref:DUF4806 domain-containing protein n=1 Tax=Synaphobranchus kaupii TaxID=118154 RepID=A0A9Q1J025_SYNKA|nr:hypothetical protein SKAU_G00118930 [Synaphobranchus kaupii]